MGKQRIALAGVAILIAIGGLGTAAWADTGQEKDCPPGQMDGHHRQGRWSVEKRLKRMTVQLGLSGAQQTQIKQILEDQEKQLKALRSDQTLTRDQKRDKFREIGKASFATINAALTPEQQRKHDAMREKARERWQKKKGPAPEGSDR